MKPLSNHAVSEAYFAGVNADPERAERAMEYAIAALQQDAEDAWKEGVQAGIGTEKMLRKELVRRGIPLKHDGGVRKEPNYGAISHA